MIGGPRLSQDGGLVISQNRIGTMRLKLMNLLSKLSQWGNFISSCGRHKGGTSSGIRKQITFADSIRVTMILIDDLDCEFYCLISSKVATFLIINSYQMSRPFQEPTISPLHSNIFLQLTTFAALNSHT